MSNKYAKLFGKIKNAEKVATNYSDRLGVGYHTVALQKFNVKESKQNMGDIIEADFVVLESNVHPRGMVRGWAWFPDSTGLAGKYEQERVQNFLETAAACIGEEAELDEFAGALVEGDGNGLTIECEITAQTNRDGTLKINPKDKTPYTNIRWYSVAQTIEEVADQASKLDGLVAEFKKNAPTEPATNKGQASKTETRTEAEPEATKTEPRKSLLGRR